MAYLFIDSTYDISIGLLDESLEWISFEKFSGQKASTIIQKETYNLLNKAGLAPAQIKSVITIAGPGFYTGLRLSEGFADVFTFSGIKHYAFLSYSIPHFTGVESGTWMTKAYRGEYFFHHWDKTETKNVLVATKELENYLANVKKSHFYIHSDAAIDDLSRNFLPELKTTFDILKSNPKAIFKNVLNQDMKVDSFYFRAPEDEFKLNP